MDDSRIVELFYAREERAVEETQRKYGSYFRTVSWNILKNREDVEECLNDTYIRIWNAIPPQRPMSLRAFGATIVRNLSLTRYRAGQTLRRGGGQVETPLDELTECVGDGPEQWLQAAELSRHLDKFLRTLPEKDRCVFLRRYWFLEPLDDIAQRYRLPLGSVKSGLHRTRKRLKEYFEKEELL